MSEEEDYADRDLPTPRRVPWLYVAATFVSLALMAGPSACILIWDSRDGMVPALIVGGFAGPITALVVGWGVVRLWLGEGRTYPDLRWLVWLPIVGFICAYFAGV